jgi:hypothetical protein
VTLRPNRSVRNGRPIRRLRRPTVRRSSPILLWAPAGRSRLRQNPAKAGPCTPDLDSPVWAHKMIKLPWLNCVLLATLLVASSARAERPNGKNCHVAAPPPSAGEKEAHGVVLRVYPRAKAIDTSYSGRQVVWAPHGSRWVVISAVEIVRGDPVRTWTPYAEDASLTGCRYRKGRVTKGSAADCAAPEFLLAKSLAPGCVQKQRKAVAAAGLGAANPAGCSYE